MDKERILRIMTEDACRLRDEVKMMKEDEATSVTNRERIEAMESAARRLMAGAEELMGETSEGRRDGRAVGEGSDAVADSMAMMTENARRLRDEVKMMKEDEATSVTNRERIEAMESAARRLMAGAEELMGETSEGRRDGRAVGEGSDAVADSMAMMTENARRLRDEVKMMKEDEATSVTNRERIEAMESAARRLMAGAEELMGETSEGRRDGRAVGEGSDAVADSMAMMTENARRLRDEVKMMKEDEATSVTNRERIEAMESAARRLMAGAEEMMTGAMGGGGGGRGGGSGGGINGGGSDFESTINNPQFDPEAPINSGEAEQFAKFFRVALYALIDTHNAILKLDQILKSNNDGTSLTLVNKKALLNNRGDVLNSILNRLDEGVKNSQEVLELARVHFNLGDAQPQSEDGEPSRINGDFLGIYLELISLCVDSLMVDPNEVKKQLGSAVRDKEEVVNHLRKVKDKIIDLTGNMSDFGVLGTRDISLKWEAIFADSLNLIREVGENHMGSDDLDDTFWVSVLSQLANKTRADVKAFTLHAKEGGSILKDCVHIFDKLKSRKQVGEASDEELRDFFFETTPKGVFPNEAVGNRLKKKARRIVGEELKTVLN